MTKSVLPIILAGGAVLLLAGGKKKRSSKTATLPSGPTPYGPNGVPGPAPLPKPSKPPATKDEDLLPPMAVELLLDSLGYPPGAIDGAYDQDTVTAVMTFQMDWNALMEWLWEHNPGVTPSSPKYGKIGEDGKWGPQTESRAVRARDHVSPFGDTNVVTSEGEEEFLVDNFRDMVFQLYERKPV